MLRTLWSLERIDLGFNPAGVLTMRIALPRDELSTAGTGRRLLFASAVACDASSPALRRRVPPVRCRSDRRSATSAWWSTATSRRRAPGEGRLADRHRRLSRGDGRAGDPRPCASRDADTSDSQLVALINEEMARRYWSGRDPIGGRLRIGMRPDRPWVTVVGIVEGRPAQWRHRRGQREVLRAALPVAQVGRQSNPRG